MRMLLAILPVVFIYSATHGIHTLEAQMMEKPSGNILDSLPQNPKECAPAGIANGGYDLVSYRSAGGPKMGLPEFSADHQGMTYLFKSAAHKKQFVADPDRYLPAYGGWCAVTLALGRLTCPDFTNFKIEDDELLLFELTGFTNGQTLWDSDAGRFRAQADDNYTIVMDHE